jgi:hypothetical protein
MTKHASIRIGIGVRVRYDGEIHIVTECLRTATGTDVVITSAKSIARLSFVTVLEETRAQLISTDARVNGARGATKAPSTTVPCTDDSTSADPSTELIEGAKCSPHVFVNLYFEDRWLGRSMPYSSVAPVEHLLRLHMTAPDRRGDQG